MTYRDYMKSNNDSLEYCSAYVSEDGLDAIVWNEKAESVMIDGVKKTYNVTTDDIQRLARKHNPDYERYSGYSDLYILLDSDSLRKCSCRECPWFRDCAAMDEEMDS